MIIYFLMVIIGSLIAGKLILQELKKDKIKKQVESISVSNTKVEPPKPVVQDSIPVSEYNGFVSASNANTELRRLEQMLNEKNEEIKRLSDSNQVKANNQEHFEKIKGLLQWQVFESRQMNREIKRQLNEINQQAQQYQKEILLLKNELGYKERLLICANEELNKMRLSMVSVEDYTNISPTKDSPSAQPLPNYQKNQTSFRIESN